jgi:hypothetical protein
MKIIHIAIIASAALLASCTEDINLNLDNTGIRLVVNGIITTDSVQQVIQLTQSSSYFSDVQPEAVRNANVQVYDGFDTVTFIEDTLSPDLYKSKSTFRGIVGRTYTLIIKNVSIDNQLQPETYTSSCYLYPVYQPDSILIVKDDNHFRHNRDTMKSWKILLYAREPKISGQTYMFNVYINNKLITDTFTKKEVYGGRFFSQTSGYINGSEVARLSSDNPHERIASGDTITLEVLGIPELYSKYFSQVERQSRGSIPIFSGPPANAITNVYPKDKTVGFFVAYSASRIKCVFKE